MQCEIPRAPFIFSFPFLTTLDFKFRKIGLATKNIYSIDMDN